MKTQLLALADSNLAAAQSSLASAQSLTAGAQTLRDAIFALPDDPIPVPTGFRVSRTYGGSDGAPISAEFQWALPVSTAALLEYKGAPGNPNGPQGWTDIQVNGAGAGVNGELATFTVPQQGFQQTILFRLRATLNGQYSEPATIQFSTPENLPEALAS